MPRSVAVRGKFVQYKTNQRLLLGKFDKPSAVNRYVRALKRLKMVFEGMPGGIEGVWG
jgi:hypothetical protein